MIAFTEFFNLATGVSIVALQLGILLGVILFCISSKRLQHPWFLLIAKHAIPLACFIAVSSVIGSIIYSDVIGFLPCNLCWIQRIFIYSQAFILGLAWYKKDSTIVDYSILLSSVGILFALYHKSVEFTGNSLIPCSAEASCAKIYVEVFGYITIPVMSLTALTAILLLMLVKKYTKI